MLGGGLLSGAAIVDGGQPCRLRGKCVVRQVAGALSYIKGG